MQTLTKYEKQRVEDRAYQHFVRQRQLGAIGAEWPEYWRVNKRSFEQSAKIFKAQLTECNFSHYLDNPDANGWTIYNIQNMNG